MSGLGLAGPFPAQPGARIHLIGIGGAGMSAVARVLSQAGYRVSGSDQRDSAGLAQLRELGVVVDVGHRAGQVAGADLAIASAAIPETNPELAGARETGIPVLGRGEALAMLVEGTTTVAVAGTHGKTTTSGMVATLLRSAGADPNWLLGADLPGLGPGGHQGAGGLSVVEADEAYGSFLFLRPSVAVVTNLEEDHLDYYRSMDALREAFGQFVAATTQAVVLCDEAPQALALAGRVGAGVRLTTYGLSAAPAAGLAAGRDSPRDDRPARVSATDLVSGATGSRFTLTVDGAPQAEVTLRIAGRHNALNALGAAAAGLALGLAPGVVAHGLGAFAGASRRFEHRGRYRGADLVDDYAHHPTEIAATLEAARWGPWRRVIAVFQPHLYSRTQSMWREFGTALAAADVAVVTDVYGAREQPIPGVTGKLLVDALCEARPGGRAAYLSTLEEAAGYVRSLVREGDLVLSMGAGDITTLPTLIQAGPTGSAGSSGSSP